MRITAKKDKNGVIGMKIKVKPSKNRPPRNINFKSRDLNFYSFDEEFVLKNERNGQSFIINFNDIQDLLRLFEKFTPAIDGYLNNYIKYLKNYPTVEDKELY